MSLRLLAPSLFALALAAALPAAAGEMPIGEPQDINGMSVMGVYIQAVEMEPAMPGQDPKKTDIHLETDIKATAKNPNGFREDAWIPYLGVDYVLKKKGSAWTANGTLHPMVANDGPHYGANVALDGPGEYEATFTVKPPQLMRHTDKETGVGPWFKTFEHKGAFKFVGVGKKGGY